MLGSSREYWQDALTPGGFAMIAGVLALTYIATKVVYNLYFHPLAKYPGPALAAATDFWLSYKRIVGGQFHLSIKDLHDKYGPIVRTGPNSLSFNSAASFRDIYGYSPGRKFFLKSKWYELDGGSRPHISTARDPEVHAKLRRIIAPALSHKSIAGFEPVIQSFVDQLIRQMAKLGGRKEGMDVANWYLCATFDIVAYLAFGTRFSTLDDGVPHFWVTALVDNLINLTVLAEIHKLFGISMASITSTLPRSMLGAYYKQLDFTVNVVQHRLNIKEVKSDLMVPLATAYENGEITLDDVRENAAAYVIGGTETTATYLTAATDCFYRYPQAAQKLGAELRENFKSYHDITAARCEALPYLEAFKNEVLRFYPSVPIGFPRLSPGETIDGEFIPAGVEVCTSTWSATHSDANWERPEVFAPERWLEPGRGDKKEASNPFSIGPRNCVGRYLALIEMRLVIAKMAWTFEPELINEGIEWMKVNRCYTFWDKKPLYVRFRKREGVTEI